MPIREGGFIFAKSLQIITGLLGTAVRAFAFAVMILEVAWGMLLAWASFYLAANGSPARGAIAAVIALLLVTLCTVIVAIYFSAFSVVRKAISDLALGRTIFNALFDHALGISGDDEGQRPAEAKVPTHLTREEVESTLHDAARYLIALDSPSTKWASPVFWLAKQIQRISIWATVKVIVKSCSKEGDSVNMFQLRDRLASTIDDGVVSLIKQDLSRLTLCLIGAASGIAMTLALLIGKIPV